DGHLLYFSTGNLAEDEDEPAGNSDSVLQVDPDTLAVQAKTRFYPESIAWAQDFDLDLGSSRVIVIPRTPFAIAGSKFGDVFVLNRGGMIVESRRQVASRHSAGIDWTGIYNGMAYWNGTLYAWPGGGGFLYGEDPGYPTDTLKAYALATDTPELAPLADGQSDGVGAGYQGANIVISANGSDPESGILWAVVPASNTKRLQTGYLHAYRAADFASGAFLEIWNNLADETYFAKFNQPLIANGKVFLPTFSAEVVVYGLKSDPL
ncbi:MAG: hypothetical protein ABIZ80_06065, partial [Bryobacteraceae bacterium]